MTTSRRWLLLIGLVVVAGAADAVCAALTPSQRVEILTEAQAAYDRGVATRRTDAATAVAAFQEAIARYEQLQDDGVDNGWLQYNLGNAYLQADDVGRAIVHYRRAQRLIPGHSGLVHNLATARGRRGRDVNPSGRHALVEALLAVPRRVPASWILVVVGVAYVGFWLLLTLRLRRRSSGMGWVGVALGCICLIALATLATRWLVPDRGAVLLDDVVLRKGDGDGFEPVFAEPLSAGVEVDVIERRGNWVHVVLPNDRRGWAPAADVELVSG